MTAHRCSRAFSARSLSICTRNPAALSGSSAAGSLLLLRMS
jgi:hypothetical protein